MIPDTGGAEATAVGSRIRSRHTMKSVAAAILTAGTVATLVAASVRPPVDVQLSASTALIMGGTGEPTPGQRYVDAVENLYLTPGGYVGYIPKVVATPEEGYPATGIDSMHIDRSIAVGTEILVDEIQQQMAAGNRVVVFGYSQSAMIAAETALRLASSDNPPDPDQLSFVVVGNESNPNGGLFTRFQVPGVPLTWPTLGINFNGAPTTGSPYPTAVYTQEYDGFADFPKYPLNVLSVLNAFLGLFTQHFGYADLTPEQLNSAIELPTTGSAPTKYYMVPTRDLPLLAPVRLIPLVGNPLAELLQPALRVLINLGYGSIANGWSPGPANEVTPFGIFPTGINPVDVIAALAHGVVEGVGNAIDALKTPRLFDLSPLSLLLSGLYSNGLTVSPHPSLLQFLAGFAAMNNAGVPVSSRGGVLKTIADVIVKDVAIVKPFIDTALALGVSLPLYNLRLFVDQLRTGNVVKAIGTPIAADFGLVPYALIAGVALPIVGAIANTVTHVAQLVGLLPNPELAVASTAATSRRFPQKAAADASIVAPTTQENQTRTTRDPHARHAHNGDDRVGAATKPPGPRSEHRATSSADSSTAKPGGRTHSGHRSNR